MTETNILKQIEIELSKNNCLPFRTNSGHFYAGNLINGNITIIINGKTIKCNSIVLNPRHVTGLPEGFSDLLIIAPNGKVIFCETKTAKGKQRESQKRFQVAVEQLGHKYILARNVNDLMEVLNE